MTVSRVGNAEVGSRVVWMVGDGEIGGKTLSRASSSCSGRGSESVGSGVPGMMVVVRLYFSLGRINVVACVRIVWGFVGTVMRNGVGGGMGV